MKSLIEQKDSRKLALLDYLAVTQKTSVDACSAYLNISEKVLLLELMQLQNFIETWADQLNITIENDTISFSKNPAFEMENVYVALRKILLSIYCLTNHFNQKKQH